MSLIVDSYAFDTYDGVIRLAQQRVIAFAPSHQAYTGSQKLPTAGRPFDLAVTRFDASANLQTVIDAIEAKLGVAATVVRDGYDYAVSKSTKFLVENVQITNASLVVAVQTYRNGTTYDYSPACRVDATLTLRAIPAS